MFDLPTLLAAFGLKPEQIALIVFASLLVMGLTNLVKRYVPDHWVPLVVLVIGIAVMEVIGYVGKIDPIVAALVGVVISLMASGMWSWGKAVTKSDDN